MTHERFNRKVWAFKHDFTGALAKWLVKQSPYVAPNKLAVCINKFHRDLYKIAKFDQDEMAIIDLLTLTKEVNKVLESIPEIMALNKPKSGHNKSIMTSRYSGKIPPDDNFIDIMALAQNITCEFADREDAQAWLERKKP